LAVDGKCGQVARPGLFTSMGPPTDRQFCSRTASDSDPFLSRSSWPDPEVILGVDQQSEGPRRKGSNRLVKRE
jgi:hypothetical protein